ncbi:M48 family metallopeptidase [Aurantiacibacter aquimixticola]|uniref:PDZ domain-containing protein n=1 Tax=Aurantiacibacter aquimixticola TaxID=1958945 RepID=A0A419RRL6_9SPHN|nr:M48 family metallopeptidase [Aurantiacibacter aquimixticola]RJY08430.1 PDZ domain-containing protein [Aurantiacibacter aquimixticola]
MGFLLNTLVAIMPLVSLAQAAPMQDALATQDLRLAVLADRMLEANAGLCARTMPLPGIILHSVDQYRGEGRSDGFANGPIEILVVIPGSPAAQADLRPGDAIVSIGDTPVPQTAASGKHLRETAFDLIARQPGDAALALRIRRDGEMQDHRLDTAVGCRALVEITAADTPRARSDGQVIQIRMDFARSLTNAELAAVFAHELAHSILDHRRRKAELGETTTAARAAEVEADRLSVHLLANAGLDPMAAAQFWRSGASEPFASGLPFRSDHPRRERRAEIIEREIAIYLPTASGPTWPGHLLALRELPLD